jgi:hypothetical protein
MTNIAVLTAVALAALVVVMAHAGPAYAAQSTLAVSNSGTAVDTVVGAQSTVPAQLVMRGRGGGGGAFRAGSFRSFRVARFNRFNQFNFRNRRFVRPFIFGSVAAPYYSSYYNDCVWDGYQWVCDNDLY